MISLKGKDNVFVQIADEYKKLIKLGVVQNGEFLPSCRDLARELGINPNTVSKAYSLLEEDGYVTAIPKKGVYASYEGKADRTIEIENDVKVLKDKGYKYQEVIIAMNRVYGEEER